LGLHSLRRVGGPLQLQISWSQYCTFQTDEITIDTPWGHFCKLSNNGSKHSGWFALFTIVFLSSSDFVRGKVSVSVFFLWQILFFFFWGLKTWEVCSFQKKINSNRFSSFGGEEKKTQFSIIQKLLVKTQIKILNLKKKKKKKPLVVVEGGLVSTIWSRPNMKQATAIPMVTKAAGRKEGRKEGQWVLCVVVEWCTRLYIILNSQPCRVYTRHILTFYWSLGQKAKDIYIYHTYVRATVNQHSPVHHPLDALLITQLWMNLNRVNIWFHLGNQFCW
jgi:hypothetical protein